MPQPIRAILLFLLLPPTMAHAQQYEWQVIARPTTAFLSSVEFIDTLHGWAGGSYGGTGLKYTTDAGFTWLAGSPVGMVPSSISMIDSMKGWAVGNQSSQGRVYHTTNGGENWLDQRSIFGQKYNGTSTQSILRNTTTGGKYTGVDTGLIIRSTDAGGTWQEQRLAPGERLGKVVFVDSLHGWINAYLNQGASGAMLRTRDGGVTWQQSNTPYLFRTMTFIDTLRGWAGFGGTFFRTVDGGVTWDSLYRVPIPGDSFGMNDLSFTDTLYGWAFGGAFYQGIITEAIYHTTNGGSSWYRESIGLTSDLGVLAEGVMLDPSHGWTVAEDGRVLAYRLTTNVVERLDETPKQFHLRSNYPNPFNPTTTIEYELPEREAVRLRVYDGGGREVQTLVNSIQEAGVYRTTFDATQLASGVYYYRLETNKFQETKQMTLVK